MFQGLLHTCAKFEENPPSGCQAINNRKCGIQTNRHGQSESNRHFISKVIDRHAVNKVIVVAAHEAGIKDMDITRCYLGNSTDINHLLWEGPEVEVHLTAVVNVENISLLVLKKSNGVSEEYLPQNGMGE